MIDSFKILELAKSGTEYDIAQIIKLTEQDIIEQAAKAKGGNTELMRYKSALKFLADNEREDMKKAWIADDKQCFTNGYIVFMLNAHIDNLPINNSTPFNVDKWIPKSNMVEVELPDMSDLKAKLKIAKAEYNVCNKGVKKNKKPIYNFDGGFYTHTNQHRTWGCSSENIIKVVEILGGNIKMYLPEIERTTPAIFESENGKSIACAIRLKEEQNDQTA